MRRFLGGHTFSFMRRGPSFRVLLFLCFEMGAFRIVLSPSLALLSSVEKRVRVSPTLYFPSSFLRRPSFLYCRAQGSLSFVRNLPSRLLASARQKYGLLFVRASFLFPSPRTFSMSQLDTSYEDPPVPLLTPPIISLFFPFFFCRF